MLDVTERPVFINAVLQSALDTTIVDVNSCITLGISPVPRTMKHQDPVVQNIIPAGTCRRNDVGVTSYRRNMPAGIILTTSLVNS